jgi:DNA-binding NarL/FixJ family response regulator
MGEKIKILIADDHALLRRGLATLLGFNKDISVVGDAKNGEEAVKAAIKLKPDVVVMDLSMPVMDGVEATRQIREALPDTHVLILTSYSTSVDVSRAMEAGASGAFVKDAEDERLVDAIRTVAAGGTAFSPEIEALVRSDPHPPELTERQRKILDDTSKGLSSEQIATRLGISAYAVNQHLDVIRRKLGAQNRTEAVAIAFRKQLFKV